MKLWLCNQAPAALLFATVAACGASSMAGENTESQLAPALLFKLEHVGVSPRGFLYVYDSGRWEFESRDTCETIKGTVSSSELQTLRGFVSDPSLDGLASANASCPDASFELSRRNNAPLKSICWRSEDMAPKDAKAAMQGLLAFFDARIAELHWDGNVKDCGSGGPPGVSTRALSGSSAPVPAGQN